MFLRALLIMLTTVNLCLMAESGIRPFTGKIIGDKVRVRSYPAVDDKPTIGEVNRGDYIVVRGEDGDFYAIEPSSQLKAYVFRTYILDGVVEGDNVNVRLSPDLNAPIIAKLNKGDILNGEISKENHKWYEINIPDQVSFYIAKEYVDYVGDTNYIENIRARQVEFNEVLDKASAISEAELSKPFDKIDWSNIEYRFAEITNAYAEYPECIAKVKEVLEANRELYLHKRMVFWENKAEDNIELEQNSAVNTVDNDTITVSKSDKMSVWEPVEELIYKSWLKEENLSIDEFYANQVLDAMNIKGIVEPYDMMVYNKPGDYIVRSNGRIVAYIYSTKVDLQNIVGREVSLLCSSRPNNNFAFPAYFVLAID